LFPPEAQAEQVTHQKSTFSVQFTSPAGTLCDFNEEEIYTITDNAAIFGDPDDPDKTIDELEIQATHVNLETGYTLTENYHEVVTFDAADATFKAVGLFWHLRDASGEIVLVQAGLVVFDTNTGEVIKVTPDFNPEFESVLCPLLGGAPA
jgi:hypothetical protein